MSIEFPLRITHGKPGPTNGWLLPGADPESWIRSLCATQFSSVGELSLFPVPRHANTREVAGIFVPLPHGRFARASIQPRPLAYSLVGGRLYLPADARLRFPLTDGEFSTLFLQDVTVFLPGTGIVGFDATDAVRMADLIALPEQRGQLWNFANPGLPPLPEKLTIIAANPVSDFVEIMEQSRGDIGEKSGEKIPGYKGEPKSTSVIKSAFFEAVRDLAKKFPESDKVKDPTWVNKVEDWANQNLLDKQNREIDRLLHWLDTDPDKGLRFALPIGGEGMRGFAGPGSTLSERKIDFDLNDLGGGKVAAPWTLDWAQTQRLMTGYRDAANRELTLGRYRRAAYIFAQLLGDYSAAANALKSGGSYREASQLYGKFLNDKPEAAECLKQGGLFEEALRLYEEMGEFETMGDLYTELGRTTDAQNAYERAANALQGMDRPTLAAKLIAEKLEDPDRALDLLFASWPHSREAKDSLTVYFQLCEAADETELAIASLQTLRDTEYRSTDTRSLAEVMAELVSTGGSRDLRRLAEDSTRVIVGRHLANRPTEDAKPLTKIIASLIESDRLLKRDARRFGAANSPSAVTTPPVQGTRNRVKLIEKLRRRFMPDFTCRKAVAYRDGFVAMGQMGGANGKIHVVRHSSTGGESYVSVGPNSNWKDVSLIPDQHPASGGTPRVHIVSRFEFDLSAQELEPDESGVPLSVQQLANGVLGAAEDGLGGRWELRMTDSELVLDRQHHVGKLSSTKHISQLPAGMSSEMVLQSGLVIPMALCGRGLFFSLGNRLAQYRGDETEWTPMPGDVRRLVATPQEALPRLAIALSDGAGLIWGDRNWRSVVFFAHETHDVHLAFTRSGFLAAVDEERIQVYAIRKKTVELAASMTNEVGKPVALIQGAIAGQFRLITESQIVTYELA